MVSGLYQRHNVLAHLFSQFFFACAVFIVKLFTILLKATLAVLDLKLFLIHI